MSVNRLRLRSDKLGEIFTLNLFGTGTPQKYRLRAATGLDADDISPVTYGNGLNSGSRFYTMSLEPRSIVMRIGLNPDVGTGESFQNLRDRVYRAISAGRKPQINFDLMEDSVVKATVEGFITHVEASSFTAQPEVQVTVSCPYPLFTGSEVATTSPSVSGEGLLTIDDTTGTAPTGFQMVVDITNPLSSWGFTDAIDGDWYFNIIYNFLVGDVLYLNTQPGSLEVYVTRFNPGLGTYENISLGDRVATDSLWPVLFPGVNYYQISAPTGLYSITSLAYSPKFWGV